MRDVTSCSQSFSARRLHSDRCKQIMADADPDDEAQTKKRVCGKRCVAMNCSNTHKDGVSLHHFPIDRPPLLSQWVKFVKTKLKNWSEPTKYSVLCDDHI